MAAIVSADILGYTRLIAAEEGEPSMRLLGLVILCACRARPSHGGEER
jgi:hypothetical protein